MEIVLESCNNIDFGKITLQANTLNIKYGINGTGKSSISKAITTSVNDKRNGTNELKKLLPFKLRGMENVAANISGIESLTSVEIFDESYVENFLFQSEELVKGSFNIFIRGENYDKGIDKIELLVKETKEIFSKDQEIQGLIADFSLLSQGFGRPTQSGIHGSSKLAKGLGDGNPIINIPEELGMFKDFLQNKTHSHKWIKWQHDGKLFIDLTDRCPYCISSIKTSTKDNIKRISEIYDPKKVENINGIIDVFENLGEYFNDETKSFINKFIRNVDGYTDDEIKYLRTIREEADRLREKFINAQNLGFYSLKDIDEIVKGLESFKINMGFYTHFNSEKTNKKVKIINDSINDLLGKAGNIQGKIAQQKILIEKLVNQNKSEINAFLKNAGYEYYVDLKLNEDKKEHELKLVHNDIGNEISDVNFHLSFGEKNAFAIILFMYDALNKNPDLIILDDPISSFDKNKKYAVMEMLFRKTRFFREKTVLLLTHDFDPIVDILLHHSDLFAKPSVTFLENDKGILSEQEILKEDVKNFIEINCENIKTHTNTLTKLVYLRRLFEATNSKGNGYHLISKLLHKRDVPEFNEKCKMLPDHIKQGTDEITPYVPSFEYEKLLIQVKDDVQMVSLYETAGSNYEKLHIYRIIFDDKNDKEMIEQSDVIKKFINEAFHIENNYIYHLDPCKYQVIPHYIIDECDRNIELLKKSLSN